MQDDSRLGFVPSSMSPKHLIMQNKKSTSHQYFIEILSEKTYTLYFQDEMQTILVAGESNILDNS